MSHGASLLGTGIRFPETSSNPPVLPYKIHRSPFRLRGLCHTVRMLQRRRVGHSITAARQAPRAALHARRARAARAKGSRQSERLVCALQSPASQCQRSGYCAQERDTRGWRSSPRTGRCCLRTGVVLVSIGYRGSRLPSPTGLFDHFLNQNRDSSSHHMSNDISGLKPVPYPQLTMNQMHSSMSPELLPTPFMVPA